MKYIFSVILFLAYTANFAQTSPEESDEQADTVRVKKERVKMELRGMHMGFDAFGAIKTAVVPPLIGWEITSDIDLKKYMVVFDYGNYRNAFQDTTRNLSTSIDGDYFRLGIDGNVLKKDPDRNALTFGIRYGWARFEDQLIFNHDYAFADTVLTRSLQFRNLNHRAHWLELNMGMKAKIYKGLWLGYQTRLKFRLKYNPGEWIPFEVPGYGPTENISTSNSTWGFNYYILYYIPFKRDKP
ncbi:MAG: DUF6048 family protein [Cyclobacteriaceae bacterium]|nr:DUF6048 family protein [Cyclobacteriaceae bacterium]